VSRFSSVRNQSANPRPCQVLAPLDVIFGLAPICSVDAAVVYHGGDTEKYLGEVDGLDAPLLMHLAEEDEFISKPAQAEIKTALARKPNATVYSYPGQRHAFARHNGRTTMPRRQRSPTGGLANFYINNCGDLRWLQPFRGDCRIRGEEDGVGPRRLPQRRPRRGAATGFRGG
jgi:hypothetical protein